MQSAFSSDWNLLEDLTSYEQLGLVQQAYKEDVKRMKLILK